MKVSVCLVCLKTLEDDPTSDWSCGPPLLNKFFNFLKNHLKISSETTQELLRSLSNGESGGELMFCEKCELSVINPICQVYLQLLSTQLRLSGELEQLNKLLKNSNCISDSLTDVLGVSDLSHLVGFRKLLTEKCELNRLEWMPSVPAERLTMTQKAGELGVHKEDLDNYADLETSDLEDEVSREGFKIELVAFDGHDEVADIAFDPLSCHGTSYGSNPSDLPSSSNDPGFLESLHNSTNTDDMKEFEATGDQIVKFDVLHASPTDYQLPFESEDVDQDDEEFLLPNDPLSEPDPNHPQRGVFKEKCSSCDRVFLNEHSLHVHFDQTHQLHTCASCRKIFAGKKLLRKHILRFHHEQGIHHCHKCKKSFQNKIQLVGHIKRAHKGRQFICKQCNATFKTSTNLKRHEITTHSNQIHRCPHCPRKFTYTAYLKKHIDKSHSSV